MEIKRGKLIECFAITPNFNFSWMRFQKGAVYYIQLAWLRWYINLVINVKCCDYVCRQQKILR